MLHNAPQENRGRERKGGLKGFVPAFVKLVEVHSVNPSPFLCVPGWNSVSQQSFSHNQPGCLKVGEKGEDKFGNSAVTRKSGLLLDLSLSLSIRLFHLITP